MRIYMTGTQKKTLGEAIEESKISNGLYSALWVFLYVGFVMVNLGGGLIALYFLTTFHNASSFILDVDTRRVLHNTCDRFLSIALDSSIVKKRWRHFNLESSVLSNMVSAFSPSYLRFGGTASDCLIFDSNHNENPEMNYPIDGQSCMNGYGDCELFQRNSTINETEWLKVNKFAQGAGLDLLFDLNVLLRDGKNWDSTNAVKLIEFSYDHQLPLSWQLGNEPNLFEHIFQREVSGTQLAKDFSKLRDILDKVYGTHVKLVGPDVTRPSVPRLDAVDYLIDFLKKIRKLGMGVIDAVTWHHYYLDGNNSTLEDYINPSNFKVFYAQTQLVMSIVSLLTPGLPVWITETSNSYGGGTPNITDHFVGGFMWMDKLGSAAANGIQVVTRQSIIGGYYGLIDKNLKPTPDYWLCLLHKKLVGPKVLSTTLRYPVLSSINEVETLKFYAHCAPHIESSNGGGAITIFGYNLGPQSETVVLDRDLELADSINVYTLTGEHGLQSQYTLLNGKRLEINEDGTIPSLVPVTQKSVVMSIPSFAMVFWQIIGVPYTVCA